MRRLFVVMVAFALAACDTTTTNPSAGPRTGDAVRAQETALSAAIAAEDAAAVAAFYAPDAQMFNPMEAPATTPDAVRASYQHLFDDPNGSLTLQGGEETVIPSSGDYVLRHATFTVSFTDPQTHRRVEMRGNTLMFWRKQDDDSWKIMFDMATPGAP